MIECIKCGNETRTTNLVSAQGEVMLAGTLSSDAQPILAYVCTACGYIELYAPQTIDRTEAVAQTETTAEPQTSAPPVPAATPNS